MINLAVNLKCRCARTNVCVCMCVGGQVGAAVEEGVFSGKVPAKDAKQQMEYQCFLVPEN